MCWRMIWTVDARTGRAQPYCGNGFQALPPKDLQSEALREAIASLSPAARAELYSLMRMGQGHLATKTWRQGVVAIYLIVVGLIGLNDMYHFIK